MISIDVDTVAGSKELAQAYAVFLQSVIMITSAKLGGPNHEHVAQDDRLFRETLEEYMKLRDHLDIADGQLSLPLGDTSG